MNMYIRSASFTPKTFTFPLAQNRTSHPTPTSKLKYLGHPSPRRDALQANGEGPEVRPGTEEPAHRLPVGSGSAGEAAASLGTARVRSGRADCTAKLAGDGRARLVSDFLPRRGAALPPPQGTCRPRLGGGGPAPALGPSPHPGQPRRGRRVSEGLRDLLPLLGSLTLGKSPK
ncbi:PREDICTED: LOW QUALITY PROTEIN: putative uncharacterized protein C14orf181 [Cercocebus atys]|uniref:LOW QUALITY PROTEIN: putative uncharacterized protein C14orf181 n=1 Tax=Cercocebus atys TaxID=9531 RepID=UPI0005F3CF77|nr:PREDICTED: LOW QUALITY PROTEIN: putative uncharacterized protein C14orf181 [Cercocebus atys]